MNKQLFGNARSLKNFLAWCKSEGIIQVKVGDIEVVFSPYVNLPDTAPIEPTDLSEADEEDLLYWST